MLVKCQQAFSSNILQIMFGSSQRAICVSKVPNFATIVQNQHHHCFPFRGICAKVRMCLIRKFSCAFGANPRVHLHMRDDTCVHTFHMCSRYVHPCVSVCVRGVFVDERQCVSARMYVSAHEGMNLHVRHVCTFTHICGCARTAPCPQRHS